MTRLHVTDPQNFKKNAAIHKGNDMYKLTIEFKDLNELTKFVLGDQSAKGTIAKEVDDEPNQVEAEIVPELPAKKSALRTKKTEAKAPSEEPVTEKPVPSVVIEQPPIIKPIVQPKAPTPSAHVEFDRAKAIARATELVNALKASGIADDQLMPNIHAVYAQAGCPLNLRISQFDTPSLEKFLPLFEQKVASLVKPAVPAGAFI